MKNFIATLLFCNLYCGFRKYIKSYQITLFRYKKARQLYSELYAPTLEAFFLHEGARLFMINYENNIVHEFSNR